MDINELDITGTPQGNPPYEEPVEEVVDFDDLGAIYTVDGENFADATIHDAFGNEMVMLDIDGDGLSDLLADPEVDFIDGDGGLDFLEGDGTFLAQETDGLSDLDGMNPDSLFDDII